MDLVEVGWGCVDWIGLVEAERSCEFGIEPFGFHEMLRNYRVSKQLWISRVVLSSIELVMCTSLGNGSARIYVDEAAMFSSSVVLTRLSGPRSRPTACQKIW
jgi:hypothetical protein